MDLNNTEMKNGVWLILLAASAMVLWSCEDDLPRAEMLGDNREVIGTWVESEYRSDVLWLERRGELDPERYGFSILEGGAFLEHKNSGWCGTPPISYASFEGTWKVVSDSLLEVTVGYWGGTMNYQIRLVQVEQERLAIRYLYGEELATAK